MAINYRRMAELAQERVDLTFELVLTDGLTPVQTINAMTYMRDAFIARDFALNSLSGSSLCPCCGRWLG